jgi:prophage tail gpP-like protein
MAVDNRSIETLAEIVTHEILNALAEENIKDSAPQGQTCKVECVDSLCVTTCFDEIGQVMSAGAERISSNLGTIPDDLSVAKYRSHFVET